MPARLAIAPVLAAWKPWAANSLTAAAMTCSRRSSDVDLTTMAGMLLIDLSDVKAQHLRAGGREGAYADGDRTRTNVPFAAASRCPSSPVASALSTTRRSPSDSSRALICTNAPTGAGATRSTSSRPVPANIPRSSSSSAIVSSSAAAITPPCAYPGGPWWSCFTKNRPSTPSPDRSSSSCSPNRFAWPQPKHRSWCRSASATQLTEHEVEDAAQAVVAPLVGRVDSHPCLELHAIRRAHGERAGTVLERRQVERFLSHQPQGLHRLPFGELQRQHAHPDQVGPMDPLVRLGDHKANAQQARALRRPVARRAGAVLPAGKHAERRPLGRVLHRRLVDRCDLAVLLGEPALGARCQQVPQPDVGEGAAHHDLVVPASRAVGVEVALLHPVLDQVLPGR